MVDCREKGGIGFGGATTAKGWEKPKSTLQRRQVKIAEHFIERLAPPPAN